MAETFATGLASGLNGLLSTLRNDRERKAQENFKLKVIEDDRRTNQEIAERVRKQRALEVFGRGLNEIKDQKVNGALTQLSSVAVKHAKASMKPLDDYKADLKDLNTRIKDQREKLASYLDKADAKTNSDPLNLDDSLIKDKEKKAEFNNTKNVLQAYMAEKESLLNVLNGGAVEQTNLQNDLETRAEALRKYSIDDALNTREARVLQLSLGLTDEDIAPFRSGSQPSGTNLDEILSRPFTSSIGAPKESTPNLESLTQKDVGVQENPARKAILKEKVARAVAGISKDITSLKVLSSQDFRDAIADPEISPILQQGLLSVKTIGGAVKQRLISGTASKAELETLNNITKLGSELTPDQFDKIRSTSGDDGATTTIQSLSELATPDTFSGLSRLNETKNINTSQKGLRDKLKVFDSGIQSMNEQMQALEPNMFGGYGRRKQRLETDMGALNRYKNETESKIQKDETELKSLNDLILNFNDFKNTIVDPTKPYKYRPVDFGSLNR